jgi:hypothetical protein
MSNYIIELIEPQTTIIQLETSYTSELGDVEVTLYDNYNLEIVNTEKILANDLPDNIPMSKIIGNLDVSRIDNLDLYLSTIDVDGGTP